MRDQIAVCCGTPLIWTFMFSGSEWYCRECKRDFPMFNVARVDATPELRTAQEVNEGWFRAITARLFEVYYDSDVDSFRKLVKSVGGIWVGAIQGPFLNFQNQEVSKRWFCVYLHSEELSMEVLT